MQIIDSTYRLNPLAWALTEDAIVNGGPGRLDRIDPKCYLHTKPPGINVLDVAKTKALSVKCGKAITGFSRKCKEEPEVPSYCVRDSKKYILDNEEDLKHASWEAGVEIGAIQPETSPAVWGKEVEMKLDLVV